MMETLVSLAIEKKRSWDLHKNQDTYALLHGNFFGMRSNIASIVLLQSRNQKLRSICFFTCSQFCEELNYYR